jgi:hypothetical protein
MRFLGRSQRISVFLGALGLAALLVAATWPHVDAWSNRVAGAFVALYLDAATFLRSCF